MPKLLYLYMGAVYEVKQEGFSYTYKNIHTGDVTTWAWKSPKTFGMELLPYKEDYKRTINVGA